MGQVRAHRRNPWALEYMAAGDPAQRPPSLLGFPMALMKSLPPNTLGNKEKFSEQGKWVGRIWFSPNLDGYLGEGMKQVRKEGYILEEA